MTPLQAPSVGPGVRTPTLLTLYPQKCTRSPALCDPEHSGSSLPPPVFYPYMGVLEHVAPRRQSAECWHRTTKPAMLGSFPLSMSLKYIFQPWARAEHKSGPLYSENFFFSCKS